MNADNYSMYVADTGMNREEFTKHTSGQGGNVRDLKCYDKYSNCPELADGCCFNRKSGDGVYLNESCCAACSHLLDT